MNKVVTRLCKEIQKLEAGIERDFLRIGEILNELYENGWLGEEDSFKELVENNFGFCLSTARNLMRVHDVKVGYDIPDATMIACGRSKIQRIATHLTEENWETMFGWATRVTFDEVNDWAKGVNMALGDGRSFANRSDPNSGDSAQRILSFTRAQRDLFDEIVDLARVKFETTNREEALTSLLKLVKPLL